MVQTRSKRNIESSAEANIDTKKSKSEEGTLLGYLILFAVNCPNCNTSCKNERGLQTHLKNCFSEEDFKLFAHQVNCASKFNVAERVVFEKYKGKYSKY